MSRMEELKEQDSQTLLTIARVLTSIMWVLIGIFWILVAVLLKFD